MGKYSKSRAKQWNRSRGFGKWCLKMFSCSYYLSAYGTLGMRLLKWPVDGIVTVSKKFRFGVLFIVSLCYLIARVTVCCLLSVWCFSSAQFFFLLPFVINCNVLRATKKISFHSLLRQPSMTVWCWLGPTTQVFPTRRTLLEYLLHSPPEQRSCVFRSKYPFLLVSSNRPMMSTNKLYDQMESFEIINVLRRKVPINFKK